MGKSSINGQLSMAMLNKCDSESLPVASSSMKPCLRGFLSVSRSSSAGDSFRPSLVWEEH